MKSALGFLFCLLSTSAWAQSAPEPYTLTGSTFFGGAAFDRAQGCAVDSAGFLYVCGNTYSTNLPVTPGAFQQTHRGDSDGFVAKLSPDAKTLIWCTYLGGSGHDRAYGVTVDSSGFVYVVTWTASAEAHMASYQRAAAQRGE